MRSPLYRIIKYVIIRIKRVVIAFITVLKWFYNLITKMFRTLANLYLLIYNAMMEYIVECSFTLKGSVLGAILLNILVFLISLFPNRDYFAIWDGMISSAIIVFAIGYVILPIIILLTDYILFLLDQRKEKKEQKNIEYPFTANALFRVYFQSFVALFSTLAYSVALSIIFHLIMEFFR